MLAAACAAPAAPIGGLYRVEYNDVFYGPWSYELDINQVSDSEYAMHSFPSAECAPVKLLAGADGKVHMPNNQYSMSDSYNTKMYLQYVDPKQADDFGNYFVTEPEMLLDLDPDNGRISWDGGDFVENVGWGYFVVVGAEYQGYLCFINKIDLTPLNASFTGTHSRGGETQQYSHGCRAELDGNELRVYGLMQLNFGQPVVFVIDQGDGTLEAMDQVLTVNDELGTVYLTDAEGSRTVTASATYANGVTTVTIAPFQGLSDDRAINTGLISGQLQIPFNIFTENSGLAADTAVDASESWYTLSGIAIPKPAQPGLYIRRAGTDARLVRID